MYPLIVWLTRVLAHSFNPSFLTSILIFFIDVAAFEFLNYLAYNIVGVTTMSIVDFVVDVLTPTLALNLVYFVVLYWPISAIFKWATKGEN